MQTLQKDVEVSTYRCIIYIYTYIYIYMHNRCFGGHGFENRPNCLVGAFQTTVANTQLSMACPQIFHPCHVFQFSLSQPCRLLCFPVPIWVCVFWVPPKLASVFPVVSPSSHTTGTLWPRGVRESGAAGIQKGSAGSQKQQGLFTCWVSLFGLFGCLKTGKQQLVGVLETIQKLYPILRRTIF